MIRADGKTDSLAIAAKTDEKAFEELAALYERYFRAQAWWHAHGPEDGTQVLLTELWRCVCDYAPAKGHFSTFAGTTLRYCFKWENRRLKCIVPLPRSAPKVNGDETPSELRALVRERRPGASDMDVEQLVNALRRCTVQVEDNHRVTSADYVLDDMERRAREALLRALCEWVETLPPADARLFEERELAAEPTSWRQLELATGVGRNKLSSRHNMLLQRWYDWLWEERRELVRDARRLR
ncbi:MAG: hypothetical protein ACI82G_002195 [Bradymonadia bacterium]